MGQRRAIAGARLLITGASQGIGRALALLAAKRGGHVLAMARSAELLDDLAAEARRQGRPLEVLRADVTSASDRNLMVATARERFGGLDVLINNAGVGATGHFADADSERLRKVFEVNFFGLTETTRVCLPLLRCGNRPAIVNISSIVGKRALPARAEYSASKFAVQGFSEALRAELACDGIDVLVVCPGLTRSNFGKNLLESRALMPLQHMQGMTSEKVAWSTLKSLERGKHETCLTWQGQLIVLVNRLWPSLADWIVARKVRSLFREASKTAGRPHERYSDQDN
ncbi:MAG: SDR family NAD(P)-dependent oxidoreductase [Planctomycetes bacterium]|nr:SDR family NAD(P)-dependent oxidoreductase [Planctomycetota bacterium]